MATVRESRAVAVLETEVRESLVGFSHAVNFIPLFHGAAPTFGGFHEFIGQAQGHGFLTALAGSFLDPAHGQGQAANRTHFNRHLVVGTAHAAGLHFNHRLDIVDGHGEGLNRVFTRVFLLDLLQGTINDALGNCFFTAFHDHVHEFGQLDIAELRIRQDFTFRDFATTWHFFTSLLQLASLSDAAKTILVFTYSTQQRVTTLNHRATRETTPFFSTKRVAYLAFGFLAPYLERDCLRSFTPCKSSEPRT